MGRHSSLKRPIWSQSEYAAAARHTAIERKQAIVGGWGEPTPTEVTRIKAMAAEGMNAVTIAWEFGCRYSQEAIRKIIA